MTTPAEERRALRMTHEFLQELATGPRRPTRVMRGMAKACLRHFPAGYVVNALWLERIDDYEKMVAQGL